MLHKVAVGKHDVEGVLTHGLPHKHVLCILTLLPEHPPVAGGQNAGEIHDCLVHPEVIASELGKLLGPVLSDTVQPGSFHQLLYKVVIHEQFVEVVGSLALHWHGLHGLSPEMRHRHAEDGSLGLLLNSVPVV
jgi:hypothetical protein